MTTTAQQVPTDTYNLDPVHSNFGFAVRFNGVSIFRGQFEQVEAKLDGGVLTGIAQAESIKTAIPQLHAQLVAPGFFDVERTPTVSFGSTDIRIADDNSVEVDGELEIRGVAKPVTAHGRFSSGVGMTGSEVVGFELEARIDRRDYGFNWQQPLPSGGEALGWEVSLEVHLQLAKA
jgi:polyisoprenoid-binding protein YceI